MSSNKFQRAKQKAKELISGFKHKNSRPPSRTPSRTTDEDVKEERSSRQKVLSVVKDVTSGLRTVLRAIKDPSEPLPLLKSVVSGILELWEVYDVGGNIYFRC